MLWITAHVLHWLARQGYEPAAVGSLEVLLVVDRVRTRSRRFLGLLKDITGRWKIPLIVKGYHVIMGMLEVI